MHICWEPLPVAWALASLSDLVFYNLSIYCSGNPCDDVAMFSVGSLYLLPGHRLAFQILSLITCLFMLRYPMWRC